MCVRRRGFALILVLIAVAAVFAISMQSAVNARASRVETMVLHDRARHLPGARTAAALVVQGLSMARSAQDADPSSDAGLAGVDGGGDDESEEDLEFLRDVLEMMPPEQRAEFERQLEEAKKKRDPRVDGLAEGGGVPGGVRAGKGLTTMQRVGLPAAPVEVGVRGGRYRVTVRDAGGLLNINAADERALRTYFQEIGSSSPVATAIAHQIIDWRDTDSFTHERGAEQEDYTRRGVRVRNDAIVSLEELRFLPAMTEEIFERTRGGLCVSGDGRVHAGSAPREVLMTVPGITEGSVERILKARAQGPLTEQALEAMLPLTGDAMSALRVAPTNILLIGVESVDEPSIRFEGIALIGERGVEELGLKPL